MDIRSLSKAHEASSQTPFARCRTLQQRHPEIPWAKGAVMEARGAYPALGLCFGVRVGENTNAHFILFYAGDHLPPRCKRLDQEGNVGIGVCAPENPQIGSQSAEYLL